MMANRPPEANPMEHPNERTDLALLASDVETLVQHADVLTDVLASLHERHLRGEAVQDDLNAVFSRHEALRRIVRWAALDRLDATLDQAVEADALDEDIRQAFTELWSTIDWIDAGYVAYEQDIEILSWTDAALDWTAVDDQIVIEHTFQRGVDEIHRVRAPMDRFMSDSVGRLWAVVQCLSTLVEQDQDVSPRMVAAVCNRRKKLEEIVEMLARLENEFDHVTEATDGEDTDADASAVGDAVQPDESNGLDELFGSGEGDGDADADEQDQDKDEDLIGFH